jgi:hypothetical protein
MIQMSCLVGHRGMSLTILRSCSCSHTTCKTACTPLVFRFPVIIDLICDLPSSLLSCIISFRTHSLKCDYNSHEDEPTMSWPHNATIERTELRSHTEYWYIGRYLTSTRRNFKVSEHPIASILCDTSKFGDWLHMSWMTVQSNIVLSATPTPITTETRGAVLLSGLVTFNSGFQMRAEPGLQVLLADL